MKELVQHSTESLSFGSQTDLDLRSGSISISEILGKLSYYSEMEFCNL